MLWVLLLAEEHRINLKEKKNTVLGFKEESDLGKAEFKFIQLYQQNILEKRQVAWFNIKSGKWESGDLVLSWFDLGRSLN